MRELKTRVASLKGDVWVDFDKPMTYKKLKKRKPYHQRWQDDIVKQFKK